MARCSFSSGCSPVFPVGDFPLGSLTWDVLQLYTTEVPRRAHSRTGEASWRPTRGHPTLNTHPMWNGGPGDASDNRADLDREITWCPDDAQPARQRALLAERMSKDSAVGARVTTVHCVSTSYVGAGHGPGVFAHRRGHLLLTDNSIRAYCHMSTVGSRSDDS